jgi:dienelactone hydrolase
MGECENDGTAPRESPILPFSHQHVVAKPMNRRARIGLWMAAVAALGAAACLVLLPYAQSAAFILDLAGSNTWVRAALPVRASAVTTRDLLVPTRHGAIPARLVEPASPAAPSVIVFPGVHAGGVDEPRLAAFSRRLAAAGVRVLSVPLPDLRAFRITPRSTDMVEDAIAWMAADRALAPSGRVGVAGVSFAGGLALVAAGRPALAGKVQFVVSIGGHADLPRVMTYLCTGRLDDGRTRTPHDYGVAIMLLAAVDRLVPPADADPLRRALVTFLTGSSDAGTDPARAEREFDEARRQTAALAEPARTYMGWVSDRNTGALGRVLLPHVDVLGGAAALSPERSPATMVPVFLLHGDSDNVIPSSETPRLAAYLTAQGAPRVRWLLTPLLTHATVQERAPLADEWRLVSFWKALLGAAR